MKIFTKENGKKVLVGLCYVAAGAAVCGGLYYAVRKFGSGGTTDAAEVVVEVVAPVAEAIKKLA